MNLEGKVVVVTGASKGLGFELARAFSEKQGRVVLNARDEVKLRKVARELDMPYSIGDVRNYEDMERVAGFAETYGTIGVWVNNAGVYSWEEPGTTADPNDIHRVIATNLVGSINGGEVALKHMQPRNQGNIIFITSTSAEKVMAKERVYGASKAGVRQYAMNLAAECEKHGILVSTYLLGRLRPEKPKDRSYLDPEHIARIIVKGIEEDRFGEFTYTP